MLEADVYNKENLTFLCLNNRDGKESVIFNIHKRPEFEVYDQALVQIFKKFNLTELGVNW